MANLLQTCIGTMACSPIICATNYVKSPVYGSTTQCWSSGSITASNFWVCSASDAFSLNQGGSVFDIWVTDSGSSWVPRNVFRAYNQGNCIVLGQGCNANNNAHVPVYACHLVCAGVCLKSPIVCATTHLRSPILRIYNSGASSCIALQSCAGSERGFLQARETAEGDGNAGLNIATSGGEQIYFRDGGLAGTVNMHIDGAGVVGVCNCLISPIVCATSCVKAPTVKATTGLTSRSIDVGTSGNRTIQGLASDNTLGTYGDLYLNYFGCTVFMHVDKHRFNYLGCAFHCLCVQSPVICGTTRVQTPIICATTHLKLSTNAAVCPFGTDGSRGITVRGTCSGAAGIELRSASNVWHGTWYGTGSTYGFLDSSWGSWDIQKIANGDLSVWVGSGGFICACEGGIRAATNICAPVVCATTSWATTCVDTPTVKTSCILNAGGTAVMRFASGFAQACTCLSTPIVCATSCVVTPKIKFTGVNAPIICGPGGHVVISTDSYCNFVGVTWSTRCFAFNGTCFKQTCELINSKSIQSPIVCATSDICIANAGTGTGNGSVNHLSLGNFQTLPQASWSEAGVQTGRVEIELPDNDGATYYGMYHIVVDMYEYCGNCISSFVVGGHNWACGWSLCGANMIAGCTDKSIRLAYCACGTTNCGGKNYILIGEANSVWSYGHVVVSRITNGGYYNFPKILNGTYNITRVTTSTYDYCTGDLLANSRFRSAYIKADSHICSGNELCSAGFVKSPIVCATTSICLAGSNTRLFSNGYRVLEGNSAGTVLQVAETYDCTAIYGKTFACTCLQSPIVCATNYVKAPTLCVTGTAGIGTVAHSTYPLMLRGNTRYQIGFCNSGATNAYYPWLVHDTNNLVVHFNGIGDRMCLNTSGELCTTGCIKSPIVCATTKLVWGSCATSFLCTSANYMQLQTQHGYGLIGANNSSWFHFYTDLPGWYFGSKCVYGEICFYAPRMCGTTCIAGPIVCAQGGTGLVCAAGAVCSPIVCATTCVHTTNLRGTGVTGNATPVLCIGHGAGSHTGDAIRIQAANSGRTIYTSGTVGSGCFYVTSSYNANPSVYTSGKFCSGNTFMCSNCICVAGTIRSANCVCAAQCLIAQCRVCGVDGVYSPIVCATSYFHGPKFCASGDGSYFRQTIFWPGSTANRALQVCKWTTGWNGGTSEAVWGLEWAYVVGTARRAQLFYDHNGSEEFVMQSNYGAIVFNAQQNGNLAPNAAAEKFRIGVTGCTIAQCKFYACTCVQSPIVCATSCAQTNIIKNNAGNPYLNVYSGCTNPGGILFRDCNAANRGYIYFDGTANFGLLSCSGSWVVKIDGDTILNLCKPTCVVGALNGSTTICATTCVCSPIVCATSSIKSSNIACFWSPLSGNDDWQSSPITLRERALNNSACNHCKYAPNINFHWSSIISNSLWMGNDGWLNWGNYSSTGIPARSQGFCTDRLCAVTAVCSITICGTTCIQSPILCATTCLRVDGGNAICLTASNPYIRSGGSYIVVPNGIYVSGGTLYAQYTSQHRGGICNDSGAHLTFHGGNDAGKCSMFCGKTFSGCCIQSPIVCATTGANIGSAASQSTVLNVIAQNTAGAPATTAAIWLKGYEGRGIGTFFGDATYAGKEWFTGMNYAGGFGSWNVGYDASGGQAEYGANTKFRVASSGTITSYAVHTVCTCLQSPIVCGTNYVKAANYMQAGSYITAGSYICASSYTTTPMVCASSCIMLTSGANVTKMCNSVGFTVVDSTEGLLVRDNSANVFEARASGNKSFCNMYVCGSLSKYSGCFSIPHPDPAKNSTHNLQHSFVESPTEGDNIYRWQVQTTACANVITLPTYYRFLNKNDMVWVSPYKNFGSAYGEVTADQCCLIVCSNQDGCYNVLLIGTRKDEHAASMWTGPEVLKPEDTFTGVPTPVVTS